MTLGGSFIDYQVIIAMLRIIKFRCHAKQYQYCTAASALTSPVDVRQQGGVRKITLNDPKTRNCLSLDVMKTLSSSIKDKWDDISLRCIILSATGSVFSSGHNLKHLHYRHGVENQRMVFIECNKVMNAIIEAPVPVVAVVDGLAAAAGCQLVSVCDIAIATTNSSFSTPGAAFGLFCSSPGVGVTRAVPKSVAGYMLYAGLPISAEEAVRAGLVSKVVSPQQLDTEVDKVIESITSKSRAVIKLGKNFIHKQASMDIISAFRASQEVMVDNLQLEDSQEGLESFIEKRKPQWSHTEKRKT